MKIQTEALLLDENGTITDLGSGHITVNQVTPNILDAGRGYFSDYLIPPVLATGSIPSPSEDLLGMIVFDSTLEVVKICVGDAWKVITFND